MGRGGGGGKGRGEYDSPYLCRLTPLYFEVPGGGDAGLGEQLGLCFLFTLPLAGLEVELPSLFVVVSVCTITAGGHAAGSISSGCLSSHGVFDKDLWRFEEGRVWSLQCNAIRGMF